MSYEMKKKMKTNQNIPKDMESNIIKGCDIIGPKL